MKKFILGLFVIILSASIIEAQSTITVYTSLSSSGSSVLQKKVVKNKQTTTTYEIGTLAIGMVFTQSDSTTKIFRSYYEFSLDGIPTNATIQKVTVNYSNGSTSSYSFKLTEVTSVGSDLAANWSAVASGTVLHSGIAYNGASFVSTPLKNNLQNNLANRKAIVGAVSENEGTSGSESSLSITLDIEYTRPASPVAIYVKNDMHGYNGGNIGVGKNAPAVSTGSPATVNGYENDIVNMAAYDSQTGNDGYQYLYNDNEAANQKSEWRYIKLTTNYRLAESSTYTTPKLTTDNSLANYVAYLKRVCNVDFKNNLVGFSSYGTVTVNSTSYSSPTSQFQIVEQNAISVSAVQMYYNINGITYYFSQWNDGSTASSRTIYPGTNNSYTANYTGIPSSTPMNITLNYSESGQPVRISWNDHPNVNVTQYKVYRGAKVEGNFTNPVVLATLNRGTTSYTDYNYTVGGSNPGSVAYDVVPYYAMEGTWGYVGQNIITASPGGARISDNALAQSQTTATEIPTEYSIGNFPNPFNPTTTIKYQLPEAGLVTLKVYDILGREVAELVNENKSAGYYEINFDASRLTSGVYIYSIQAGKYTESKKMILAK